jgi:hypothetical protein
VLTPRDQNACKGSSWHLNVSYEGEVEVTVSLVSGIAGLRDAASKVVVGNILKKVTRLTADEAGVEMHAVVSSRVRKLLGFTLSLFSLNYDLVFETVFNTEQEQLVDLGFTKKRWSGDFENRHSPAKVQLYKLHGSVNWYFDENDEEVKEEVPEGTRPLLIFGSGPKLQSYDPFLSLLSSFRDKLKSASLYVVVGYSFHDKYINNILIQSLNSGVNKKMLVVDPGRDADVMSFIKDVEQYQGSKSMNEIVNLTKISPARVEIIKQTALDFFSIYLSGRAAKLKEQLHDTEAGDNVF